MSPTPAVRGPAPIKAEATGSNPAGRASNFNNLGGFPRPPNAALSAECPRNRARFERLPFAAC